MEGKIDLNRAAGGQSGGGGLRSGDHNDCITNFLPSEPPAARSKRAKEKISRKSAKKETPRGLASAERGGGEDEYYSQRMEGLLPQSYSVPYLILRARVPTCATRIRSSYALGSSCV